MVGITREDAVLHSTRECPSFLPKQLLLLELRARAVRGWHRWKHTLAVDHHLSPPNTTEKGENHCHCICFIFSGKTTHQGITAQTLCPKYGSIFPSHSLQTKQTTPGDMGSPHTFIPTVPTCSSAPRRWVRASPLAPPWADACGHGKLRARVSHFPARLFTRHSG